MYLRIPLDSRFFFILLFFFSFVLSVIGVNPFQRIMFVIGCHSTDMQLSYLAEMEAYDGQRDGLGE